MGSEMCIRDSSCLIKRVRYDENVPCGETDGPLTYLSEGSVRLSLRKETGEGPGDKE